MRRQHRRSVKGRRLNWAAVFGFLARPRTSPKRLASRCESPPHCREERTYRKLTAIFTHGTASENNVRPLRRDFSRATCGPIIRN
jgi:hypothetical protein